MASADSPPDDAVDSAGDVTLLLKQVSRGDSEASGELLRILYSDLKRVAAVRMAGERTAHSLQPTDLVHEAYLRLVKVGDGHEWNSRRHFFTAAAEAMRRVLIDYARQKKAQKRGGAYAQVEIPEEWIPDERKADQLIALEEALADLEKEQPKKAELVKLRFFAGLTIEQAAEALDISTTTADRYWAYARAWLMDAMGGERS